MSKRDWLAMGVGWLVGLVAFSLTDRSWASVAICGCSAFSATYLFRWLLGYFI